MAIEERGDDREDALFRARVGYGDTVDGAAGPHADDSAPLVEGRVLGDLTSDQTLQAGPGSHFRGTGPLDLEDPDGGSPEMPLTDGEEADPTATSSGAWTSRHAGAAVALGTLVALIVIAVGFALGALVVTGRADAQVAAMADERRAQEDLVESDLPGLDIRFGSLSRDAYPSITAHLSMRTRDGSPLPALSAEQVSVVETDASGAEVVAGVTGFAFDPTGGGCQLTYTADTVQLGSERTVRVSLSEQSGYRGSAQMSYRV